MIRIHVVKASHLVLGAAVAILVLVIALLLLSAQSEGTAQRPAQANAGAEALGAFAPLDATEIRLAPAIQSMPQASGLSIEVLTAGVDRPAEIRGTTVLIYHTHTHEAYEQNVADAYIETAAWRTADTSYNIVRVGARLAELLSEAGFTVIHDTTDHERTDLSTAYTRSLATLEGYETPFDLYIDIHRDAYSAKTSGNPFCATIDGVETARLMMLVGNGVGFSVKPYYAENYQFATRLTQRLNELAPGICRTVMVKDGRYNQHISPRAILVEVGHNRNTLAQALAAMPHLSKAITDLMTQERAA